MVFLSAANPGSGINPRAKDWTSMSYGQNSCRGDYNIA